MATVLYINYNELNEFYTIKEVCKLFQMDKSALKQKCKEYDIAPRRNEIGDYGFVKYDVRKLHNLLYYEEKEHGKDEDPWA